MPRCPVCRKALTQKEYESALGILGERERHLRHEKDTLRAKVAEANKRAKQARSAGVAAERSRTQRLLAGKDQQIRTLTERLKQLKRGTTPQTEGLEFEETLVRRLRSAFRDDIITHEGKAGDVLHDVCVSGKRCGLIVYECKRHQSISTDHVRQAVRAKHARRADFAVLVTIGKRRGFTGLAEWDGVLVVSPLGVLALASLLREQLKALARAQLTHSVRQKLAQKLVALVNSPDFRNPIAATIQTAKTLQKAVLEEATLHKRLWERRWSSYHSVSWDTQLVQSNVQLVLQGKKPQEHKPPKPPPLLLPGG